MGECTGRKCLDIGPDTMLSELKEANKYKGRTYCSDSCGSVYCFCLFPMEACLFYRTYAAPNTEDIFEKYKCEEWGHQLIVSTTVVTNGRETTEEHMLVEGGIETMKIPGGEVNIELTSISDESGLAIMGKTFIQKDDKIAVASAAAEELALDCNEELLCQYKETCTCTPAGEEASCQCSEVDLYKILEHKDHRLPIITEKYQLATTRDNTPVLRMKHNQIHLRVTFSQKYDISVTKSEVDCEIPYYTEYRGCYHCNQGASQSITCKAKEITHAKLSCNNTEFIDIITCDKNGFVNEIHRKFDVTNPTDVCTVKCGKKNNVFKIEGKLAYVHEEGIISHINQVLGKKNKKVTEFSVKFPDIGGIWDILTGGIGQILIVILIFLLTAAIIYCCLLPKITKCCL